MLPKHRKFKYYISWDTKRKVKTCVFFPTFGNFRSLNYKLSYNDKIMSTFCIPGLPTRTNARININ